MNLSELIAQIASHLRYGDRPYPQRDWFVLIVVSAIILSGVIVWNAWAFDTVASGGTIGPVATSTPPVFTRSSLDAIQKVFTDRAVEDQKYKDGTYRFVDPS